MTARPLAALTLAPHIPASVNSVNTAAKGGSVAAATNAAPAAPRPAATTARSPIRSVRRPQARSVKTMPPLVAAISTPMSPSDRSYSSRSAGASTATPVPSAEYAACATTPAPSTTHRYRPTPAR
jgi:hypothetical protein